MKSVKIIVVAGMPGSGAETVVDYLTEHGWPKVGPEQMAPEEIERLVAAGQKQIVLDGVHNWETYHALKQRWPGQVSTIAVVAPRRQRLKQVMAQVEHTSSKEDLERRDFDEVEQLQLGSVIAVADHYLLNMQSETQLKADLAKILAEELA